MRNAMRLCALPLLLLVGCQSLENRLIYLPVKAIPKHAAPLPPSVEDMELPIEGGAKIHARWWPHPDAQGVILYLHGNAGNMEYFGRTTRDLRACLERSILVIDYPGYGRSSGKPSEAGCYAAARAAYDHLTLDRGVPPEQIVIVGESLGGGVAVDLASSRPHEALVVIRSFTSIPEIAAHVTKIRWVPAVMFNRFDSLKKIPACTAPVFIAQADRDRVMPFAHGERLHAACQGVAHLHVLRGLSHVDPLPPEFYRELRAFLEQQRRPVQGEH